MNEDVARVLIGTDVALIECLPLSQVANGDLGILWPCSEQCKEMSAIIVLFNYWNAKVVAGIASKERRQSTTLRKSMQISRIVTKA